MEKILSISLKLNFTLNTLGSYGLLYKITFPQKLGLMELKKNQFQKIYATYCPFLYKFMSNTLSANFLFSPIFSLAS